MVEKITNCQIKDIPHIQSKMWLLQSQYRKVAEMLGHFAFGFGWDDMNKCVTCEVGVWNGWVKGHLATAGLKNKLFVHFDKLAIIFGKDRATKERVEALTNAVENIESEEVAARATSDAFNGLGCE
ncbi:uncharacterized protein LOC110426475 [Herrania umbratica]|uniref:Uncharacterized protein LOC110426475 n=1 Tax=Herrania umbratica TaxID=108875 RepID=A0A6J1BDI1_9ROSI|nr:uncharacterized protein LOC110426475 [Herrania umbratica]XP_021297361.1 uncharacterized protein LOC110426475 [Herrania umbratica]